MVVTGNFILARRDEEHDEDSFSVWYGQDYSLDGARNLQVGRLHTVGSLADVADLPTQFELSTFEEALAHILGDTKTRVFDLISIVFIIRKVLSNYERDKVTTGRTHLTLY